MEHCLLSSSDIGRNNIQNGGLIFDTDEMRFICSAPDYSGTFILDKLEGKMSKIEDVMWFANSFGRYIYYSNQKSGGRMFRFDTESGRSELYLDIACFQPIISSNDIFLINEEDKKLYRFNIYNNSRTKVVEGSVNSFLIINNKLIYSNDNEIITCSLDGSDREVMLKASPLRLVTGDDTLIFSDKGNRYILTELNISSGRKHIYDDMATISYTSNGRHIYATNIFNGSSIYRIDAESKSCFRIYGKNADYLHILGNELIFISEDAWSKMDLEGGQAVKIDFQSRNMQKEPYQAL